MLAYFLAIALAFASLSLYLSAFFVPDLHRKDDFLWSGVGLFYALILWICAGRITGSVLLGQGAAIVLILSLGWQNIQLRRAIAYPDEKINLDSFSVTNWLKNRFSKQKTGSVTPQTSPTLNNPPPDLAEKTEPLKDPVKPDNILKKEELSPKKAIKIDSPPPLETPSQPQALKPDNEELEIELPEITLESDPEDDEDLEFESFLVDNEAETLIESYKPQEFQPISKENKESMDELGEIEQDNPIKPQETPSNAENQS